MKTTKDILNENFFDNVNAGIDAKVLNKWREIMSSKQQLTNSKGVHMIAIGQGVYDYDYLAKAFDLNGKILSNINVKASKPWETPHIEFIVDKKWRDKYDNANIYPLFELPILHENQDENSNHRLSLLKLKEYLQ